MQKEDTIMIFTNDKRPIYVTKEEMSDMMERPMRERLSRLRLDANDLLKQTLKLEKLIRDLNNLHHYYKEISKTPSLVKISPYGIKKDIKKGNEVGFLYWEDAKKLF